MSDFTDRNARTATSEKMAEFCRMWAAQFVRLPADWSRRQDPSSTWELWRRFIEDGRTQLGTCGVVLGKFPDDPPAFNRFLALYFETLSGDRTDRGCSLCDGVRYLYAVTGTGRRRDGRIGPLITGPGHKAVPMTHTAIIMVICRCHPLGGKELTGERFGTPWRAAAERHAAECEALANQRAPASPDPYAWAVAQNEDAPI